MAYTPSHEKRTLSTSCLSREKMIGRTRPRAYRMTPQAAEWTITSPKMKAARRTMTNVAAAKGMKMTSLKTRYSRDRPLHTMRRPR